MYINTINIYIDGNDEYIEVVILTNNEMNNDKLKFIAIKKAESKILFNSEKISHVVIITKEFKFKTYKTLSIKTLQD